MTKTKTPFLSLEAWGTIGQAITSQKRGTQTLLRKKPIPAYRRTLPQQYQRWLYEDYAYLWTQQSEATRRAYAADGSRFHLTGFQYWMKYNLTNLPGIAGMWHLDEKTGAIAYDSSRNANHGVIIGASPATGLIDGCRLFDGINDLINCPYSPSINITGPGALELFFKSAGAQLGHAGLLGRPGTTGPTISYFLEADGGVFIRLYIHDGVGAGIKTKAFNFTTDLNWHHLYADWNGTQLNIILDGIPDAPTASLRLPQSRPGISLRIGWWVGTFNGLIDHAILWDVLPPLEIIQRHAERRYSL